MEDKIISEERMFSNKDLLKLFSPLVVEQFLEYLVGLIASIMAALVGEAAVSGVSLVEFVMALLISIFTALATGGAVIIGQYVGKKDMKKAREATTQLAWFTGIMAIVVMIIVYALKGIILNVLFGKITPEVYRDANSYFMVITASIPFLALYNAGAAIFRTMGNSKFPMKIMLTMNILNVLCSMLLILGLHMGTSGIAIPALIARIGAAAIVIIFATKIKGVVYLEKTLKYKFNGEMVKQILGIGVPFGIENGMFYFGRLLILSLVSTFGTAAIAANSVSGTIVMFEVLPGMAINLGMTAVISRCIGSGDYDQAKYYTNKIGKILYGAQVVSSIVVLALLPLILRIYGLSQEATMWTRQLVWLHAIIMILIWPLAYALPVTFRAAGDAKFPMAVSITSMIIARIALSYVFALYFHMGMFGTWVAMFVDWFIKAIIFAWRYLSEKWMEFNAIA